MFGLADPDQLATDWDIERWSFYDARARALAEDYTDDAPPAPKPQGLGRQRASAKSNLRCGIWGAAGIHGRQQRVRGGYAAPMAGCLWCLRSPERATGMERTMTATAAFSRPICASPEDNRPPRQANAFF